MLGKLIKHEFAATARHFLPLYGFIIILTPLFALIARLFMHMDDESMGMSLLTGVFMLGFFSYTFLIIAIFIATLILIIMRFYRTMATSEAYLTFTLPVKTWELVFSKALVALIWEVLASIIAVLSIITLLCVSGVISMADLFSWIRDELMIDFSNLDGSQMFTMTLALITLITSAVAGIMRVFCSVSVGQLFRNHRLAASIAVYFGINFALQIITMIFSIAFGIIFLPDGAEAMGLYYNLTYMLSITENVIVSVAGYWVTVWIMKKHLNVM